MAVPDCQGHTGHIRPGEREPDRQDAVNGADTCSRKSAGGIPPRAAEQGSVRRGRNDRKRTGRVPERELAHDPGATALHHLLAKRGKTTRNPKGWRRNTRAWNTNGAGPIHTTGCATGAAGRMGRNVFGKELRLPTETIGKACDRTSTGLLPGRIQMGGGRGLG